MTLLTPPHTRPDKENRRTAHSVSARVAWSQVNEYHSATSPAGTKKLASSASKELPLRPILKQTSYPILPLLFPENERQVTPEPSNPLSDLHYLDGPVNKILTPCFHGPAQSGRPRKYGQQLFMAVIPASKEVPHRIRRCGCS